MNLQKSEKLLELGLISADQFEQAKAYRSKNIFSLFYELRTLLYLGILFFSSGIGILIYNNIGEFGHIVSLTLLFCLMLLCFYFSFKNTKGFVKELVKSDKTFHEYWVLGANILLGIFIAYLQLQYTFFSTYYGIATLIPAIIYLLSAYYFDHRGVLSMGITGICAFIGFSVAPMQILENNFSSNTHLSYYAIAFGITLLIWASYSKTISLKNHFNFSFENFAMHLLGIATIANLWEPYWFLFFIVLAASIWYFVRLAFRIKSIYFLVISVFYAYIGFTILFIKLISMSKGQFYELFSILSPLYFGFSIYAFIQLVKRYKNEFK